MPAYLSSNRKRLHALRDRPMALARPMVREIFPRCASMAWGRDWLQSELREKDSVILTRSAGSSNRL